MVDSLARKIDKSPKQDIEVSESPLKWCEVSLFEVVERGKRLEASVFDVEARQAFYTVSHSIFGTKPLMGNNGFVNKSYYGNRLKRKYISKSDKNAIGFIGSSEMLDIYPQPVKFMKNDESAEPLKVKRNTLLISRSGTIGNITFVGKTLEKFLVSEHAIRLECVENPGYIYCYLKSKTGQKLIQSKVYGAVVSQIEPEHLADIPVPDAPESVKSKINDFIMQSYALRDNSNDLIDEATNLLKEELHLPDISEFAVNNDPVETFAVNLSDMNGRLDASYHVPIVDAIVKHLKKYAAEVTTIGDKRISSDIVLPVRFKRVYVDEEHGVKFVGGKEIHQLIPATEKYLSKKAHSKQLKEDLGIKPYSILTPARGSLGDVELPCKHFYSWAISDNMMQILSYKDICGYLYVFLGSEYGKILIQRFTYGGVVDAIEPFHIQSVEVPILKCQDTQARINSLALQANEKRYQAYLLEQEALRALEDEVIYAK